MHCIVSCIPSEFVRVDLSSDHLRPISDAVFPVSYPANYLSPKDK